MIQTLSRMRERHDNEDDFLSSLLASASLSSPSPLSSLSPLSPSAQPSLLGIEEEGVYFSEEVHRNVFQMSDVDSAVRYLLSLPKEETEKFLKAVMKGEMDRFVDEWVPWWIEEAGDKLGDIGGGGGEFVEEIGVGSPDGEEHSSVSRVPKVPENIPPFSQLFPSKQSPSPSLLNNLVDVIFAYALTSRRNYGDLCDDVVRTLRDFYSISLVFSQNFVFPSISDALRQKEKLPDVSKGEVIHTIGDCKRIFHLKRFVLASLGDIYRAFVKLREERGRKGKERKDDAKDEEILSKEERKKYFLGERKTLFFLSLSLSLPPDRFQDISLELMALQGIHEEEWKSERERRERERDPFRKERKILIPIKK
jgi:hypothetical protein